MSLITQFNAQSQAGMVSVGVKSVTYRIAMTHQYVTGINPSHHRVWRRPAARRTGHRSHQVAKQADGPIPLRDPRGWRSSSNFCPPAASSRLSDS